MIISENGCQFLVKFSSYVEITVMHVAQWRVCAVYQTMTGNPSIENIPPVSGSKRDRWNHFYRGITCYCLIHSTHAPLVYVHNCNFHIAAEFDQKLTSIFRNDHKLRKTQDKFFTQTRSNKIVHYSAIHCTNLSCVTFRLFELFIMKNSKSFFKHLVVTCMRLLTSL